MVARDGWGQGYMGNPGWYGMGLREGEFLATQLEPIPEPATLSILAIGVGSHLLRRRRTA